uniref:Uncharacterized protein n=1 Tax=Arundo donax TaxID=35708 RepID=A0A0A8YHD5_ARUDO
MLCTLQQVINSAWRFIRITDVISITIWVFLLLNTSFCSMYVT